MATGIKKKKKKPGHRDTARVGERGKEEREEAQGGGERFSRGRLLAAGERLQYVFWFVRARV